MRIFGLLQRSSWSKVVVVAAPLVSPSPAWCGKHEDVERYRREAERCAQLKEAVAWCNETGKKGYAASHRLNDDGEWFWPLVTEGSCKRRLAGDVDNDHPWSSRSVLTPAEETDLVATCKELNAHGQGIDREQLGKMVYDSLLLRETLNAGRDFTPLSHNAKQILESGQVGQGFFSRFFADHPDIAEKRAAAEEILRAKWMTREVSQTHFAKLRATLERVGLLDERGQITDPRRILNSDECPNPWRGTGQRGKIVAEVGKPCVKLVTAAREHTTLDVLIGMDGHLYDSHLIFKGEYIQRQMIPDRAKLPNSKVSATAKGYQTGSTLLETLKFWDRAILARGIRKPVVWTTDGHSSRLNTDVLRWCRENEWIMYISPPHTTGIHQALDQIFKSWHDTFNGIVKRWCDENTGRELNKRIFTDIFAEAWGGWAAAEKIVAAFRRVGLSVKGVDPSAVPSEKFVIASSVARPAPEMPPPPLPAAASPAALAGPNTRAAALAGPSDAPPPGTPAVSFAGEWKSPSPEAGKYEPNSVEYWKAKQQLTSSKAKELFAAGQQMQQTPLTLKESHPAWQVKKAEPVHDDGSGRQRVKGEWGDMDSVQMLEKLDAQHKEEEEKREAVQQRKEDGAERRRLQQEAEAAKKQAKEATLALERPVTDLIKSLGFTAGQSDDISAGELAAFARKNRAALGALGVDLTSLSRKALMPQLTAKIAQAGGTAWQHAPPKALPAPAAEAAAAALPPPAEPVAGVEPASPLALPAPAEEAAAPRPKRARSGGAAP